MNEYTYQSFTIYCPLHGDGYTAYEWSGDIILRDIHRAKCHKCNGPTKIRVEWVDKEGWTRKSRRSARRREVLTHPILWLILAAIIWSVVKAALDLLLKR